ncbi:SDR family oxidoreductase, partial [Mycobacteroides abscessus]|uniref:SDR family oxidoreductase n=1 Tax=Mycobacteroides abscessus TaxID=36809 RepID=UPI00103CDA91
MKYIVTGGTGFIGRRIVTRILETQPAAEVAILVRREVTADHIVHCAAIYDITADDKAQRAANV